MTKLFCWIHLLLVLPALVQSQSLVYHDTPREVWRKTFNAIGEGNGVYLTPSGDKLIAVSRAGILRAYDPTDGSVLWTYSPSLMDGGSVSCQSGITFIETFLTTHLAYMVMDTVAGQVSTRILTVDLDGVEIWQSANVQGEGAGSPQASNDGRHFAITHNVNQQGYFSLFDTASSSTEPIYQYQSDVLVFDSVTPFSAVGVYHSPLEGFYDSDNDNGRSNTNDLFVFMSDTNTDVVNPRGDPRAGNGQMYVFQFPVDYFVTQDISSLAVIPIGTLRGYQAHTAPVLTDGGRAMYWNMVRGEVRGWVDQRFSRGHSGIINLGRGDPAYMGGRASPTLSHDPTDYSVFGPGASELVWKSDSDFLNVTTVATDAVVSSRLAVTLDDEYVVYGTQSGALVLASSQDLSTKWVVSTLNPIKGDLAVDERRIFVGDDQGNGVGQVVAFEMASMPTESPSSLPTSAPSPAPNAGTSTPTLVPTRAPTTATPTRVGLVASPVPTKVQGKTKAPVQTGNTVGSSGAREYYCFWQTVVFTTLAVLLGVTVW